MLAPIAAPNSADAAALASTNRALAAASRLDGLLDPLGRQREVRIASEVAGKDLGAVDDDAGLVSAHRRERLLRRRRPRDRRRASSRPRPAPTRMAWMSSGRARDLDVAEHRAALLRQAGHVDGAAALALEMGGHGEDRADRHDAGAADAGDEDARRAARRSRAGPARAARGARDRLGERRLAAARPRR